MRRAFSLCPEAAGSRSRLERVKCRTAGRSLPVQLCCTGGPGEDRHLTRGRRPHTPGRAGQGVAPQGRRTCPACHTASVGSGAKPQGFPERGAFGRMLRPGAQSPQGTSHTAPPCGAAEATRATRPARAVSVAQKQNAPIARGAHSGRRQPFRGIPTSSYQGLTNWSRYCGPKSGNCKPWGGVPWYIRKNCFSY